MNSRHDNEYQQGGWNRDNEDENFRRSRGQKFSHSYDGTAQGGYSRQQQQGGGSPQQRAQQGDFYRGGFYSEGQSPNPGSHSYGGQYGAPYGSSHGGEEYGNEAYGPHQYPRYVYGPEHAYRPGQSGPGAWNNAPSDEQLRLGSRLPYSDQVGYGRSLHTGFTQASEDYSGAGDYRSRGPRLSPKSYQRSDERLKEDIYERLSNQWDFDATEVIVEVDAGKVVLKGSVPDRRTRHAIENLADSAYGVRDIENNLRVESMWQSGESQNSSGKPR